MKNNGRLIIRDGVKPEDSNREVFLVFSDADGTSFVDDYVRLAPFAGGDDALVAYEVLNDNTIRTTMGSAMEFLYTYTWGRVSLDRESQELYGIMTRSEYTDFIENNGYNVVYSNEYVQQGYVDHLSKLVKMYDVDGYELDFPSTNMLLVAEKD